MSDLTPHERAFIIDELRVEYGSPVDGYVMNSTARNIIRKLIEED